MKNSVCNTRRRERTAIPTTTRWPMRQMGVALMAVVACLPLVAAAQLAPPPLMCVMDVSTARPTYSPDESVQLSLWIKVNSNPALPEIENARLEVKLRQRFGSFVTLTQRSGISLPKGTEWSETLFTLFGTGEPFRNLGEYQVQATLLAPDGEVYCEAYTAFRIKSVFGQDPSTRTLIVTSRRTSVTEPFVSKLVVWLEAAYQTEVHVLYQEGIFQSYQSGLYEGYDVLIYYATDYDQPPPAQLIEDLFEGEGITKRKVVWIGYHLDKIREYLPQYGLKYGALSTGNEPTQLLYLDSGVSYDLQNPDRVSLEVVDYGLARARAALGSETIIASAQQIDHPEDGECFYAVGFHPTAHLVPFGAHLVFCDLLSELYGINRGKTALLRLEDVNAFSDPDRLLAITRFLNEEGVPFTLALIPIYVDEQKRKTRLSQDLDFRIMVKSALLDGGEFVLHGDTHQFDGVTPQDYEFWDERINAPIGDAAYVEQRIADARMEIEFSGLGSSLVGWETPHYAAGEETYAAFERDFSLMYEDPHWGYDLRFIPYAVELAHTLYVPTNLGYVSGASFDADMGRIIEEARLLGGLQYGALASFYFHPSLGPEGLQRIVEGLKAQGWTFEPVSSLLDGDWRPEGGTGESSE